MQYGSFRALLSNIIDYAGTYPPAALPLNDAIRSVSGFRKTARFPWLVGRLAIGAKDIQHLSPRLFATHSADGSPWWITQVADPLFGSNIETAMLADWNAAIDFNTRSVSLSQALEIQSIEWKLSDEISVDTLHSLIANLPPSSYSAKRLYFEPSLASLDEVAEQLTRLAQDPLRPQFGIKVRTGGAVIPSTEELAKALTTCARYGMKFKATQGLHHAVTGPSGFGFVNLFFALGYFYANEASVEDVVRCLKSTDIEFARDHVRIDRFRLSTSEVENARSRHSGCFGSCSADEPDQFLSEEIQIGER